LKECRSERKLRQNASQDIKVGANGFQGDPGFFKVSASGVPG
jgi:hypothetical protein